MTSCSSAAHSRRRIVIRQVPPKYDRTITSFDASGRLLQVEYGLEAANRGSTVAAAVSPLQILVVARQVHRLDRHVFLFATGLSGDARALASSLRTFCQQYRLSYGEAPSVEHVARQATAVYHELTRTGGARPIGCTAVLAGISETDNRLELFRVQPGGVEEDCWYCAAGKGRERIHRALGSFERLEDEKEGLQKFLTILSEEALESPTNLWILRPNATHRGGIQATCILDVDLKDVMGTVHLMYSSSN